MKIDPSIAPIRDAVAAFSHSDEGIALPRTSPALVDIIANDDLCLTSLLSSESFSTAQPHYKILRALPLLKPRYLTSALFREAVLCQEHMLN